MHTMVSEYLYLGYKLRLSLCVKVPQTFQARFVRFIFTDIILFYFLKTQKLGIYLVILAVSGLSCSTQALPFVLQDLLSRESWHVGSQFLNPGLSPCPLQCKMNSQLLDHQGCPTNKSLKDIVSSYKKKLKKKTQCLLKYGLKNKISQ